MSLEKTIKQANGKKHIIKSINIYAAWSGNHHVLKITLTTCKKKKVIFTKIKPEQTPIIERDIINIIKKYKLEAISSPQIPKGEPEVFSESLSFQELPIETIDFINKSLNK